MHQLHAEKGVHYTSIRRAKTTRFEYSHDKVIDQYPPQKDLGESNEEKQKKQNEKNQQKKLNMLAISAKD